MKKSETVVFVSGCYDVIHGGHIDFFHATGIGDRLIVSVASDEVYRRHKGRLASQPDTSKRDVLAALKMVDEVYISHGPKLGLDFEPHFLEVAQALRRRDRLLLVVTDDDRYEIRKRALCARVARRFGIRCEYMKLSAVKQRPLSTTQIVQKLRAPTQCPLRVDFGGGWLDLPRHARPDGYIVNCAITPMVSLSDWPYEEKCGLGGSAAWAFLHGKDPVASELANGTGWQDPAVIQETGLCVWRSGPQPELAFKSDGAELRGLMALRWTGKRNMIVDIAGKERDYDKIQAAGALAKKAVANFISAQQWQAIETGFRQLVAAMRASYLGQLGEGMQGLRPARGARAWKYCGGGFGGYALYLFESEERREAAVRDFRKTPQPFTAIEPYCR